MKLGELIEIKHGYAFSGEHIVEDDNGIVLVTPGNFRIGGGFKEEKCKFFDGEIPADYVLKEGDFIVTMTDLSKTIDTLGYSALVPKSKRIYLHNQRIGLVTFKSDECDRGYIYWLMRTREYQRSIANTSTGATVHHTSPKKIYDYDLEVPPLPIQHRIANILSRYDSLIENYQKQIKLLEEAAQRLYKEWFIDLHFPGHENTNIIDGVPEGWEMKKVGEIAIISAGGDKPDVVTEEQTTECQVPIYSNGTTKEGLYGYTNKSSNTAGSITVSARGSIGFACLRMHDYFSIVRLISIKPQNNVDLMYLFQFTKVHTFMSNGAAQQQLTVPMVKAIDVVYPAESLLEAFENVVLPLYKKVQSLQSQLRLLTEARDRLLPKLMSGEITV